MSDPMTHEELKARAESAELGCEIAYRREPTQAEGDAHEYRHEQSMGPEHKSGECFVPMGGWTGRRCRVCSRWVWGGPTACVACDRVCGHELDAENARHALEMNRIDALFAYGVRGGPGAWRWASDPEGTTLDTSAAWERMLSEMRERAANSEWCEQNAPGAEPAVPDGPAWAMGYTDATGTVVVEYCDRSFGSKSDAEEYLSHAPMGLWYWEGAIIGWECREGDYDCEAVGKFLSTTARLVKNGDAPGDEETPAPAEPEPPIVGIIDLFEALSKATKKAPAGAICPLCDAPVVGVPATAKPNPEARLAHRDCEAPARGASWVLA